MRILVVADRFPWPTTGGGQMRLAATIEALAALGDIDFFYLSDKRAPEPVVPLAVSISRVGSSPYPDMVPEWRWRAAWLARRGTPMEIVVRRFDTTPRSAFTRWAAAHYDLVWCNTLTTYEWLGRPRLGPTIIDLDNLESEKERQREELMQGSPSGGGPIGFLRHALTKAQVRLNARDWKSLERSAAGQVEWVVLCSELDVRRSGLPNAVVITNSYRRPAQALGRRDVSDPPVVLFQGTLEYGPNVDAAVWLVDEVGPRIRSRVPALQIRLVGKTTPAVDRLHHPPEVTVVGRVPDMGPELSCADLAVVPLRSGSGTRLKILESFAHRLPVVSTTIGAEGLEVQPDVHLLVADDAAGFSAACERLLTDGALRERMVDAAERLYGERYERSVVDERIQALAVETSTTSGRSQRGD
jgi:glycosyltransferase involved in cell wall biosynthesis